jgi:SAM-dependent methyltransferase
MFIADLALYKKLTLQRSIKFAKCLAGLMPDEGKVLDFGCGNMYTSRELSKLKPGLHITGIDVIRDQNFDESLLSTGKLDFCLLTTRELPFPDNTFEVSFALAVMHHTDNPEYYLSELKRVTKPSGCIILIEEMYINWLDKIYISAQDWILNKMKAGVPVPLNFRSKKHYLKEFERQGLTILHEGGIRAFLTNMHAYVFKLKKSH